MFSASTAVVLSHSQTRAPQIEGANFLNLLIVDHDRTIREACREVAQSLGFTTQVVETAEQAYRLLDSSCTDAVLLDLRPGTGSLDALHTIKKHRADAVVIVVTGYGTVQSAVQAMKDGAYDYVTKPFSMEELRLLLERGGASAAEDGEPRVAGNHQVAAGVRQPYRARAGDGKTLPHHRESRTERASGADSGGKRHGQRAGGEVDSRRWHLPQQALHSG